MGSWFAFVGLATAIVQGGLLGRLVARFGEAGVARMGALLMAVGFVLVPPAGEAAAPCALVFGSLTLIGAVFGMCVHSMIGLSSRRSDASFQGRRLGV